jgi:hypothetical protein
MPCADNFFHHSKVRKANTWCSSHQDRQRPWLVDLSRIFPGFTRAYWCPEEELYQGYLPRKITRGVK